MNVDGGVGGGGGGDGGGNQVPLQPGAQLRLGQSSLAERRVAEGWYKTISSHSKCVVRDSLILYAFYSGRGKFMPLPLKSKILETPGFLVTDYIKMFPL